MKIYKLPDSIIFDTTNPNYSERLKDKPTAELLPISENKSHYNFLIDHFPEGHPVFSGFGESYYYYYPPHPNKPNDKYHCEVCGKVQGECRC